MTNKDTTFAIALNCMDGRVQLPVNQAVCKMFGVAHVDTITEAGIVKALADHHDARETTAALASIRISVHHHGSRAIAIAAHHDCAGNAVSDEIQKEQLGRAVLFIRDLFPECNVLGLWIGPDWVAEVQNT